MAKSRFGTSSKDYSDFRTQCVTFSLQIEWWVLKLAICIFFLTFQKILILENLQCSFGLSTSYPGWYYQIGLFLEINAKNGSVYSETIVIMFNTNCIRTLKRRGANNNIKISTKLCNSFLFDVTCFAKNAFLCKWRKCKTVHLNDSEFGE